MKISIKQTDIILDRERAIFLPLQNILAISDLHLGKAAHFRKAGLAVPNAVLQNDLARLETLLGKYKPNTLLINGDMFHSDYNSEIDEFKVWRAQFPELKLILVEGNHDKHTLKRCNNLAIDIFSEYTVANFCFVHDTSTCNNDKYRIGGHIHPGVSVYNKVKQKIKIPCFYFGEHYALLPAFSNFTGLQVIKPKITDEVFAITPKSVVKV